MSLINLNPAHEKALEKFSGLAPGEVAAKASVIFDPGKKVFCVPFLGVDYLVNHPGGEISAGAGGASVSLTDKVCILHYLVNSSGYPPTGKYITFRELPGGSIYTGPFNNRAIRPLVSVFGNRPEKLVDAGIKLGGEKAALGDWG